MGVYIHLLRTIEIDERDGERDDEREDEREEMGSAPLA